MIGDATVFTVASRVAVDIRRSPADQRGQAIGKALENLMRAAGDAWPNAEFGEMMANVSDILCEAIDLSDRPALEVPMGTV